MQDSPPGRKLGTLQSGTPMAEIIPFTKHLKAREKSSVEFAGLPADWKLLEFSPESTDKIDKAVIKLFRDADDLQDCRLFHVVNNRGEFTASLALLQSRNWVERTAFNSKIRAGETLQALAKLYRTNKWMTEFDWSRGYVFGDDGIAYSVNALPDAIDVYGSVTIKDKSGVFLPPMFSTLGNLTVSNSTIALSPRYIRCFDLFISCSSMHEVARRLAVVGEMEIEDSSLKRVCHTAVFGKDVRLTRLKRRVSMPESCTVAGDLILKDVNLDIFDQNIVMGDIKEEYTDNSAPYLGRDFLGQLLAPFSEVKFLNLVERDRYGYPINIQDVKNAYGYFVSRNDNGSYLCVIGPDIAPRQFVDVFRMDVIGVRKDATLPTL